MMFQRGRRTVGWKRSGRGRATHSQRRADFRRKTLLLEPLEARRLLTIDLSGVPDWLEQGPGPIDVGGGVGEQVGMVHGIAVKPGDPNTVFVATGNGGVWRSLNATDPDPIWEPVTDQQQALSMAEVAFDPNDPSGETWYAGFGFRSNGFGDGVANPGGILRTIDNGETWTVVAPNRFASLTVTGIAPTTQTDPVSAKQIVLVSTAQDSGGVFRSTDGGNSFTLSLGGPGNSDGIDNDNDGLTDGADTGGEFSFGASGLVADPGNPSRFYAALPERGVFRTDDAGASWQMVNGSGGNVITGLLPSGTNPVARNTRLLLAVHDSPGSNVVYAGVIRNNQSISGGDNHAGATRLVALFRSTDQGANWRQIQNIPLNMGVPNVHPNSMAGNNAYLTAHPTDPNVLFVGGAATPRFRVVMDDGTPANDSWADNYASSNGTSPHADPRQLVFANANTAYETSDGGIYRLLDPDLPATRMWEPMIGNLRPTEFFSVSYDPLNSTVFGGAQDNGSPFQRDTGDPDYPFTWDSASGCDGGGTAIDISTLPGFAVHYTSSQNFDACGGLMFRVYDANNVDILNGSRNLEVMGTGGTVLTAKDAMGNYIFDPTLPFMVPYVLNSVNPARMVIGTSYLYESADGGNLLVSLGGVMDTGGGVFVATGPVGAVNPTGAPLVKPIAYGGRSGGVDNEDVLWVGALQGKDGIDNDMDMSTDEADERTPTLLLRTSGTGLPAVVPNYTMAPVGGGAITDIVMDPEDWHTAYLVDVNGSVFRAVSNDDGTSVSFTNLTGNLGDFTKSFRTIEFVRVDGNQVLMVGGVGGVYRTIDPGTNPIWTKLGLNLPNGLVNELNYTPPPPAMSPLNGDVLLVGMYGRGAWSINDASRILAMPSVLNVCGDANQVNQDDTFLLIRDEENPLLIDMFVNGVLEFQGPLAALQQINVFGVGGNDELIIDSSHGLITVPTGIRYDGDGICSFFEPGDDIEIIGLDRGFDTLTLTQTGGNTQSRETVAVGQLPGSGSSTIVDDQGNANAADDLIQTVYFEELEPITSDVPVTDFNIIGVPGLASLLQDDNQITYTASQIIASGGRVEVDNFEPIEFKNKTNFGIAAGSGDDTVFVNNASLPSALQTITVSGDDGDDSITFVAVPDASATTFVSVTASGNGGDDRIDASEIAVNTPFTLNGDGGADRLIGGPGNDTINGGAGDDLLLGGDPAKGVLSIGNNTYDAGTGFDTLAILGTLDDDTLDVTQTSATALTCIVNGSTASETFSLVAPDQVLIEAKQGDDVIRVAAADSLFAPAANPNTDVLRFHVIGDAPHASDRLLVADEGTGDLVLVRQSPDGRSGSVSIAPAHPSGAAPPVIYEGIERLDIVPQNPVTGGTGSDSLGRVVVFQPDPFELNDNRLIATDIGDVFVTHRDPTIDPGVGPLGAPGDEDWYEFRAPKVGTFRFDLFFDEIASVPSGRSGLPGNGNLDMGVYDASGTLIVAGNSIPGGEQAMFSAAAGTSYFLRVAGTPLAATTSSAINTYDVDLVEVDLLGPQLFDPDGAGGVDPIHITNDDPTTPFDEREFDLFHPKPAARPTPPIPSLTVNLRDLLTRDLPNRAPGDVYGALDLNVAGQAGHYLLVGDHNGVIPIAAIVATNNPVSAGATATATVELQFANPLPDDRFTLTIFDSLLDPPGNRLDGQSNALEPQQNPSFPTGDGVAGGNFTARFTVDSRAELGVWAAGSVYIDTNGNFGFDPENQDNDATNEDITYVLGFTSDDVFAGNFAADAGDTADGFDKLATYGRVAGAFRWLIDTDNNGVPNLVIADPSAINGLPVAGNFDGSAANGDEVALKDSTNWHLDTNHDFKVDTTLAGNMIGYPIVGDFDGDGIDDLGAWSDDTFRLDLSTLLTGAAAAGSYGANINGITDVQFRFGFPGVRERPVASDFDGDGIDDLGLWAPDRSGAVPQETAEWYIFISAGTPIPNRIIANPQAIGGNIVDFTPVPFGNDLYAQFGDDFALPVVGNFDPPVAGNDPPQFKFAVFTNPVDPLDVNDDGLVTPLDVLYIFNVLNRGDGGLIAVFRSEADATGPFYDPSADGYITPLDALMVINRLNARLTGEGEAEGVFVPATRDLFTALADDWNGFGHRLLGSGLQEPTTSDLEPDPAAMVVAKYDQEANVDAILAQPQAVEPGRADGLLVLDREEFAGLLDELADDLGLLWGDDASPS